MASSEQQIDDAVAKRHIQNTDTALGVQSSNLDMNLHKIIGLEDPTGDLDAAHKKYVDDHAGGNVVGPGSAVDSAVVLFDGITGALIKDSARLIEDVMTDGSSLPDGHAIKAYGDANWAGGGGDVSGPVTNTDDYVPQWDGADSKLLKNGFVITVAGKALIDDADVAAQRTTLELLSAALRSAEDTLTDGSNLPDGHAIKTYGDANWGGGGGYTNLTEFVDQTGWRLFYSNNLGDVIELALGTSGQYLKSGGIADAPTWDTPSGAGDVVGPGSAIDDALPLFDGTTGKLIKDSTRLVEDTMTDGSNLPDGHAIKTYGDANWAGGGGDVVGPGTHAADYVPQWNGTPNSKILVEGFAITVAGKALVDDADAAAQRVTLGLLSAALRNAEDSLTDGSNLPDGHAVITYGDANWGGGSSKWTDAGQYVYPNAGTKYRILDAGTNLATVTFDANTVYVLAPGATYDVNTSIIISNNFVSIVGNGATIRKTAQADGLRITGNRCRVVGVEIDGNSQGWSGIFVTGSCNVIDGVISHNNGGIGIGQDGQSTTCQYNRIVNCEAYSNSEIGISMNDVDFAVVSNNVSHGNTLEGFTCDANSPGWASSCMFDGNIGFNNPGGVGGFGIDRARNCTFSNNVIDSSGSNDGMKTQNNEGPVEYCVFTGNVLINNGGYGINITSGTAGASHHNKLVGNIYRTNTAGDYYVIGGQNNIVIETAGGGSGDVVGPSSAVNNALPLFDGTTGKLIKDSARLIEDSLTDGSNLPDGHAVITYGNANWGGGSSKWTDAGAYVYPNNWSGFRIHDSGRLEMASSQWVYDDVTVNYTPIGQGQIHKYNQLIIDHSLNASDHETTMLIEAKTSGSNTKNKVALMTAIELTGGTNQAWAINPLVQIGSSWAPSSPSWAVGCEIDLNNGCNHANGNTQGLMLAGNSTYAPTVAMSICMNTTSWKDGIWLSNISDNGIVFMSNPAPSTGILFQYPCSSANFWQNSGDMTFHDPNAGTKTLTQLAAAGGGINNVVEDLTPQLGGDLDLNTHMISGLGIIGLENTYGYYCKNTGGSYRKAMCLNASNDWEIGLDADMVIIGYGSSDNNPVMIRVNGDNNKQVRVGSLHSGGTGYRMLRVPN